MRKYTCHFDHHQRSHWSTNGKENWVRKLLDNQTVKLLVKQKLSNKPNQFQIQSVKDRSDFKTCLMEETRPVLRRSMLILFVRNSVLQKERSDLFLLWIRLMRKTAVEHVLLMKAIRSTLKMNNFVKEWKIHCWSWRESWVNDVERGRHGLLNSRTTTFRCETRAKYQRSTIDSENWEPPRSTRSSTRSTTESNDSGCWEHRIMWITRDGTQNAVHSVFIILDHWYTLLHMGAFLAQKERPISNPSVIRWGFFQFLSTLSRKEDFMDIDMVKSCETRNTLRLTNWRKDARESISKESMTESYETQNSVVEWLKIIETKNFVDDGMLLWMKVTLTSWRYNNTLYIRANGGFNQLSKVLILYDWRRELISNKFCLPCIDCNEKQKETHKCLFTLTQVNNGHRVLVLLLKVTMEMHQVLNERSDLLIAVFGKILLDKICWIQLICYSWIVYSWRRSTVTDGECKHNTSNDPFSRCQSVQ